MDMKTIYEDIKNDIRHLLPEKRYKHCLNVEAEAVKLARIYGCDVEKARIAAIAHDYAKAYSGKDIITKAQDLRMDIDELQYNSPGLLHGPVAAQLIADKYNMNDQEVLNSISYHTTGRVGMTLLEKIIFIADLIEPGRNFEGIAAIREMSLKDMDRALLLACNFTLVYITQCNYLIHPLTIQFRNSLLLKGGIKYEK